MKTLIVLLLFSTLYSESLCNEKISQESREAMENKKIKCRWVCDKKIYKEQKIAEAILYYKNSKYYKFKAK